MESLVGQILERKWNLLIDVARMNQQPPKAPWQFSSDSPAPSASPSGPGLPPVGQPPIAPPQVFTQPGPEHPVPPASNVPLVGNVPLASSQPVSPGQFQLRANPTSATHQAGTKSEPLVENSSAVGGSFRRSTGASLEVSFFLGLVFVVGGIFLAVWAIGNVDWKDLFRIEVPAGTTR